MTTSLSRYTSSLVLLEWGAIMLYFGLRGRLSAFLHPAFHPLFWLAGTLLVLTAAFIAFSGESGCCEEHHVHERHGNVATKGMVATKGIGLVVLCFPIALAAIISPDGFGETFVRNRWAIEDAKLLPRSDGESASASTLEKSSMPSDAEATVALSDDAFQNPALRPDKEGSIHAEVVDLIYASGDPSMRKDFENKQVALIGQVAREGEARSERGPFRLVRFVMVCCAADVQPASVPVLYPKASPNLELMSWVKVIGRVRFQRIGNRREALVEAVKVVPIAAPADQYLY